MDVERDHEGGGEWTMGSAMRARDDGEVGVVVDMVFVKKLDQQQFKYNVLQKLHLD